MQQKRFLACTSAALLATAIACSKSTESPVSPSAAQPGLSEAGPSGETLKVTAPTPQSPVNNAQPDQLVLMAGKSTGRFDSSVDPAYSYEFQIMNAANATVCTATVGGGGGGSVAWTPPCILEFDAPHTWRVRAVFQGAVGPWSSNATFRSPSGGYLRGNEIFDPLVNGRTAGDPTGVTFIPGVGARMNDFLSRITYVLPENLQGGEFSLMTTGVDEGNDGDKTKIMSMQEGFSDLTSNDYRMTVEKRGRRYMIPGAVTFRIITGDAGEHHRIHDGPRIGKEFSDENWYFWRFTWQTGSARLEVRRDGPRGPAVYDHAIGTGTHPYRPVPHVVYVGGAPGRGGPQDATVPGMVVKNVWLSSRPRPAFPGE